MYAQSIVATLTIHSRQTSSDTKSEIAGSKPKVSITDSGLRRWSWYLLGTGGSGLSGTVLSLTVTELIAGIVCLTAAEKLGFAPDYLRMMHTFTQFGN